jgi:hypothetical protein
VTAILLVTIGGPLAFSGCGNTNAVSGSEPCVVETAQSALKIGPTGHALDYFPCATEGGTCVVPGGMYLAYGANGQYRYTFTTGIANAFTPCNNATFGGDPAPGVVKACYFANYGYFCDEGQPCQGQSLSHWAYGNNGNFNFKQLSGSFTCNSSTFGGTPIPGVSKCFMALLPYSPAAVEGGTLTGLSNTAVGFGAAGTFVFAVATGSVPCTVSAFGSDPAPGVTKTCYKFVMPFVTDEGNSFSGTGFSYFYSSGLNGNIIRNNLTGMVSCSNATFGGDPDYGHVKNCYGPL